MVDFILNAISILFFLMMLVLAGYWIKILFFKIFNIKEKEDTEEKKGAMDLFSKIYALMLAFIALGFVWVLLTKIFESGTDF